MNDLKLHSLERYLIVRLVALGLVLFSLAAVLLWYHEWPLLWYFNAIGILGILIYFSFARGYKKIFLSHERASLHLDAITQEDFNQFAKSPFSHGRVSQFHDKLNLLSKNLRQQKSRYDQHVFLVYQLIEQLDTPILVFNQKQQLIFGNAEFQRLFGQPWQMLRHSSPELLGLVNKNNEWQLSKKFSEELKHQQWQIRKSEFIDEGERHQLLVFINIDSELRQSQLNAWQQIIRVLGHEIRNSLTPVSSIAESLSEKSDDQKEQQALSIITNRCQHLQQFVERYSSVDRNLHLACQSVKTSELAERVTRLFESINIEVDNQVAVVWLDGPFFEQVLINLIKNSIEAGSTKIVLSIKQVDKTYVFSLIDDGHGFSNLNNLFIPLYTTKPQGQGIGLSFCRNVIEQHQGTIEILNNKGTGASVNILIPLKQEL